ncbi:MAG: 3-hydroxylacyl-ACP dehydratase [Gammaproteobacteria bacterium]
MNARTFLPIRELVPHQGEMVLLDHVVSANADSLCAAVTIGAHSVFFDGAGVGSWVGIEYMAQAIAAHAGYQAVQRGEPVRVGFLLGSRRYLCSVPLFRADQVLHVHAQHVLQGENGLAAFDCRIMDAATQASLATGTLTVFQPDNVNEFLQRSF